MSLWTQYLNPKTIEGALDMLAVAQEPVALIAGGTDLLLDLKQGRHAPVHTLVDISQVTEMRQVSQDGGMILVGAAIPLNQLISDSLIRSHANCLVEACGLIGGPQVRNVATLGGNVSHALPAGDGAIALLALEAEAELASIKGRRWMSLIELYDGPGVTTFDRSREILVRFRFRARGNEEFSAFNRIMRPQGVAIAIQNMAIWVKRSADGMLEDVRLALGPAGPIPLRAKNTEKCLIGSSVESIPYDEAVATLRAEAKLRTSRHRATEEYREHLLGILLRRTMTSALMSMTNTRSGHK